MSEYTWDTDWKTEANGTACDVKNFSEFIENQARSMEQSGITLEALHLRRWIPELRNACKTIASSSDPFPLSFR
jgi:hypothetical protein